jgi:mycoredoxin
MMSILDTVAPVRGRRTATVPVVVYGNRWCGLTQMVSRGLDRSGVDYQYVDLDLHPEIERRLRLNLGRGLRTPLVYVGGDWYMAPSMRELQHALARHGLW